MNIFYYAIVAFFVLWMVQKWFSTRGIRQITTEELKNELKQKDKLFIDVRTPAEFQANHIKGFQNIPLQQFTEKAKNLPKDKEIVLICHSGARSSKAASLCKKMGYQKITNVRGGIKSWGP